MLSQMLLPALDDPTDREALRAGGRTLSYRELRGAGSALAARLVGRERVAVWATPTLDTCVAVVAVLLSGGAAIPLNPKMGSRELEHVIRDSGPAVILASRDAVLPDALQSLPRLTVDLDATGRSLPREPDDEALAFIFYTSGTTGPPKGVLVPRRAVASNLDALALVWRWTAADVLTHGLPLFHVHGLILGVLGPLRT